MNNPDQILGLLAIIVLLVLGADLWRHGPRGLYEGVLRGVRWVGLMVLGLLLSLIGVLALAGVVCFLLAGVVLVVALLLLVLVACAWMVPVLVLGGVLVIGCMELLP